MARKSAQPALYELIRRRSEEQSDAPARPMPQARVQEPAPRAVAPRGEGDSTDHEPVLGDLIAPGRSIRVPVGYLFVGAAAIVALAVLAYVVGHSSGEGHAKAVLDQQAVDEFNAENAGKSMSDPLVSAPTRVKPTKGANPAPNAGASKETARGQAGSIESDPREVGTNYYYLVYTDRPKAIEFADFCRENGLDAYVVQGDNPELRRVMVMPGFAAGQSSLPEFRQLRERIEQVITRWKLKTSNRETLTYYPEKFKG
jgi:hypothetical protein